MSVTVICRWGGGKDDKYFARIGKNVISVYETDTFTLIDKKSIKVENVMDISWSPTDPILALFVPELGGGNQPARVSPTTSVPHSLFFLLSLKSGSKVICMLYSGESHSNPWQRGVEAEESFQC